MPSALPLRTDHSPADLRRLARKTKDNNQSRRLLSLAAVLDGMNRTDAARIGSRRLNSVISPQNKAIYIEISMVYLDSFHGSPAYAQHSYTQLNLNNFGY